VYQDPEFSCEVVARWAGGFMGRAGVRGEEYEKSPILQAIELTDPPHLTPPSPLRLGAEREFKRWPVFYPGTRAASAGKMTQIT
jgi:hypothetical protein